METSKFPTLLSTAASLSADEDFSPWWKNDYKIIMAALNPARRDELVKELIALASNDIEFRHKLMDEFKHLGKGQVGKRSKRPRYLDHWIHGHVESILRAHPELSLESAFDKTSEFFVTSSIRSISPSSVKSIYYTVKRAISTNK